MNGSKIIQTSRRRKNKIVRKVNENWQKWKKQKDVNEKNPEIKCLAIKVRSSDIKENIISKVLMAFPHV